MKEHGLLAPHRPAPRVAHPHDGTIVTERVDQVWGSDMTQTITTTDGRAYVFIAVDHCSGEFTGVHAASGASRWEALEPIRQGVIRLAAHLFTHRDAADEGAPPAAVAALWRPWRRMRLAGAHHPGGWR